MRVMRHCGYFCRFRLSSMRLTHFVCRHIEENQRIRDHPVRASLSAFTPVTAASLCSSLPAWHIPARRHPHAAAPHMAYAAYAAYAANVLRASNVLRVSSVSNVFIAAAMCANPGAASRHISAKRGGNARNTGDYAVTAQTTTTNERLQRQQLNEMKGQP